MQNNLVIVEDIDLNTITGTIRQCGVAAHFTNGTYALPSELIVPTTLAGFKRVTETYPSLPLVIAINSDISMRALGKTHFESQNERASKVAEPLAALFPNNIVIIVFYDEITPNKLYDHLNKAHLTRTLHKWGYGVSANGPKIEGAESFDLVYGFELPNDTKPVCYDDTAKSSTPQNITIENLNERYISRNGVLFEVPDSLRHLSVPEKQRHKPKC